MTVFNTNATCLTMILFASLFASASRADEPTGRWSSVVDAASVGHVSGEPTGRWKGRWSSGTTGHSGPMRARVTPAGDGSYKAVFVGRFAGVIPFVYRADLQPTQTWDGTVYVTEKKLPLLGSYRMSTIIPGNTLSANWSAVGDTGQVSMQRVSY